FFIGQIVWMLTILAYLAITAWLSHQMDTQLIEAVTPSVGMIVVAVNLVGVLLCCLVPEESGLRLRGVLVAALVLLTVGPGVVVGLSATNRLDLGAPDKHSLEARQPTNWPLWLKIDAGLVACLALTGIAFFQLLAGLASARKAEGLSWKLALWPFVFPGVVV